MLKILGLAGAGNTFTHQNIISELLYSFMYKAKNTKKYSNLKILPEIGLDSKIPDLVVYKLSRSQHTPMAVFEISISNAISKDIKKCEKLMLNNDSINEAFVIDITSEKLVFHKLYKLKSGKISTPKKSSSFDTMNLDLSNII